jgi:chemotaxis signal transduction protein
MSERGPVSGVVCRVGTRRVMLALEDVREVCTGILMVRMPGVAAAFEGVANVRGSVVTVVRAAELLGIASDTPGPSPWLVVLRYRDGGVALGVDEVEDLDAPDRDLMPLDLGVRLAPLFEPG